MSSSTESAGLPVVTPQELNEFLALAKSTKLPLMVRGGPGVGKSSIFRQFAAAQGDSYRYLDSQAIYFDPTDIKGFPKVNGKVTEWLPPAEFPTQGEGMWVIEELPSAAPAVQAAFYQLMLDRQIGAYRLPDGWFIVATGNRLIDKGVVNRMPSPLVSRMWHVELQVSIDAWTEHALGSGIVPELIAFFRLRSGLLNNFDPKNWVADTPYCCPRTVEFLSRLMQASSRKPSLTLVCATIGESAGIEFYSFLEIYKEVPSLDAILLDPDTVPVPEKPAALYALMAGLARKVTPQNADRMFRYLARMPKEFEVCGVRDCQRANKAITQTTAFTEWAVRNAGVLS